MEKLDLKEGDKVVIRGDLNTDIKNVVTGMVQYKGDVATIKVVGHSRYKLTQTVYSWTQDMFDISATIALNPRLQKKESKIDYTKGEWSVYIDNPDIDYAESLKKLGIDLCGHSVNSNLCNYHIKGGNIMYTGYCVHNIYTRIPDKDLTVRVKPKLEAPEEKTYKYEYHYFKYDPEFTSEEYKKALKLHGIDTGTYSYNPANLEILYQVNNNRVVSIYFSDELNYKHLLEKSTEIPLSELGLIKKPKIPEVPKLEEKVIKTILVKDKKYYFEVTDYNRPYLAEYLTKLGIEYADLLSYSHTYYKIKNDELLDCTNIKPSSPEFIQLTDEDLGIPQNMSKPRKKYKHTDLLAPEEVFPQKKKPDYTDCWFIGTEGSTPEEYKKALKDSESVLTTISRCDVEYDWNLKMLGGITEVNKIGEKLIPINVNKLAKRKKRKK